MQLLLILILIGPRSLVSENVYFQSESEIAYIAESWNEISLLPLSAGSSSAKKVIGPEIKTPLPKFL